MMIDNFESPENRFLSNFYEDPDMSISYNGLEYRSTEAAYQAQKESNPANRRKYTHMNPSQSKKVGRNCDCVPNWNDKRDGIMLDLLRIKFAIPFLAEKLKATAPHELVEGNSWGDIHFGVCRGKGENVLGKLLMKVRKEITKETD